MMKGYALNEKKKFKLLKRIFDIIISLLGLFALLPLFILVALAIIIFSPGPVFFKQERIGLNGIPFHIYKFRTMHINAEKMGKQITVGKDPRITAIGNFLRNLKLDEFPQLINVLKGEMSLVGPRPEVKKYVNLYNKEQRKVLSVRPGMTDYASIKYRNENDVLAQNLNPEQVYITKIMPDKLAINLKYIEEMSFSIDIKLILVTILRIFDDARRVEILKSHSQSTRNTYYKA